MKVLTKFVLPLAALLFAFLLIPQFALAGTANCPAEPATNVPIASGDIFVGSNCALRTTGDVDSFVFTGNKGDTWQLAAALNGGPTANICLTVYDPSFKIVYGPGCTGVGYGGPSSVVIDQALATTGTYTMDITENSSGTQDYAVSVEHLYPFPPNAQAVSLGKTYAGDISALTDSNAFTFEGATTGEYEVAATLSSSPSANVCMTVYSPGGGLIKPSVGSEGGCTGVGYGGPSTVQIDFTPTETGIYMAFVSVSGNDATQSYSLEVSCVVGECTNIPPPPCTLKDAATYNATTSTLTMNFTVGNNVATTWNAWLTYQDTMQHLFSVSQPITNPPKAIAKTRTALPKEGTVGVLSTLTTPTKGIFCSSYVQVNTGTP
ncbi:MAG: hypothetical protein ACLQBK_06725 [Candidatus Sulfotelmatobacter sp.]